jgi:predicted MFS family arabinose efflux permease
VRISRVFAGLRTSLSQQPHVHELILLASVLALDSADRSSIGAVAPSLKDAFALDNTEIGALSAAFAIVGVIATVPAGVLADRVHRARLLAGACVCWSVAMIFVGLATNYSWLFVSRLFLGAMIAVAGPVTASLTGDLFSPVERGRALSLVDMGELVGAGAGFVFAATIVVVADWRAVYWLLGVPGALLAYHLWRMREPARGAQSAETGDVLELNEAERAVSAQHIEPHEDLVLVGDQSDMPLAHAIGWVLRVPTNVIIIIASSMGTMFLTAVQTFGVLYVVSAYGVSRGEAVLFLPLVGAGAVVGTIAGGRTGDLLLERGVIAGRIWVGIAGYVVACAGLLPALLTRSIAIALPFFVLAGAGLGAANPPLDAARLDIVHPQLWGRAESVRSVIRTGATAASPLLFGLLADAFSLRTAFLVTLPALLANGLMLLYATRSYPSDVATVAASVDPESSALDPRPPT